VDQVSTKVSEQVSEVSSQVMESVTSTAAQVSETVTSTVSDVSESVSSTAAQMTESVQATATIVSSKAAEVMDFLISDEDDTDSDDEFETFKTSDAPEFRGLQGLNNFHILQEDVGIFSVIYDFYIYMLKKPLPEFACAMFAAPVLLSVVFTFLYLPDVQGLAFDDTARNFFDAASGEFRVLSNSNFVSLHFLVQLLLAVSNSNDFFPFTYKFELKVSFLTYLKQNRLV